MAAALQYGVTTTLKCEPDVEDAWDSLFRFVMDCLKLGMRKEQEKESHLNSRISKDIEDERFSNFTIETDAESTLTMQR